MPSGTLDLNLKKISWFFQVLSLWTRKTPKNYYGSLLPSTINFISPSWCTRCISGTRPIRQFLISTFYRKALTSPWKCPFFTISRQTQESPRVIPRKNLHSKRKYTSLWSLVFIYQCLIGYTTYFHYQIPTFNTTAISSRLLGKWARGYPPESLSR